MLALLAAAMLSTAPADTIKLQLVPEKAMQKIGYYMPMRVELASDKPGTITKVPGDLAAPLYGVFDVTGAGGTKYAVIVDEPDGKPARLFIDTNGNGDLTDDPAPEWNSKESGEGDSKRTMYNGSGKLDLGTKDEPFVVGFGLYRFDKNDPQRAQLKNTLLYFRDYALEGEMKLGEKTYHVLLSDDQTSGDFRGKPIEDETDPKASSGVVLMIDVNANGKFDKRGEKFDVRKPFNIGGTTYEIADMSRTGQSFTVATSSKTVAEVPLPPDLRPGQKIIPFEAQTTDGKTVTFPDDFKGKIVMLDFWATWCGPCMKEVPGLVKAYEKFHDQGFEVLGVSLDSEKTIDKMPSVMKEKGMTWRQVADGKFWDAAIARKYTIDSIPACWLIDGDTGEILADEGGLRGEALQGTIEKQLAKKKGGA